MDRIFLNASACSQLEGLTKPVEIVDPTGRFLGRFLPNLKFSTTYDCPYSNEELKQMRSERGGRSLEEIWKSLGAK